MPERTDESAVEGRFRRLYLAEPADPAAEARAMRALRTRRMPPRTLWGVGLAAAAALTLFLRDESGRPPARTAVDSLVPVRFVLVTKASHVSVVGDFNGWDPDATPMTRADSDELWEVNARMGVGRVEYAFVVDGRTWIPDPNAPLAPENEFGARNSVLTVRSRGAL
ncbi:MAG: isoamylase early set domain-containing protein [Gemmatimonadetes bacterium]|nr:isoamylase early set domain-containing protein [Gemmatimonadota bacterium]